MILIALWTARVEYKRRRGAMAGSVYCYDAEAMFQCNVFYLVYCRKILIAFCTVRVLFKQLGLSPATREYQRIQRIRETSSKFSTFSKYNQDKV